jgi:hypothetical protein
MPKSNHYYPRYEGSNQGQKIDPVRTMSPPPVGISIRQGNIVRGFLDLFFGGQSYLQYLPAKKKKHQKTIISPPDMEVQKCKFFYPGSVRMEDPVRISIRQGKKVRGFLNFPLENNPIFNIYP